MAIEQQEAADFGFEDFDTANINAAPDDGAHLADFRAPDIGGEDLVQDDVARVDDAPDDLETAAPETMSKEAFWTVFKAVFQIPSAIVPDFAPLAIQPEEEPIARPAADACHDLLSIYYPRALMPMGDTFALILTAGPFLLMKVQLVRAILADRAERAAREAREAQEMRFGRMPKQPHDKPQPANESSAPKSSPLSWMDQEIAA